MLSDAFSQEALRDALRIYYGIEVFTLTALLEGADIEALVYKATTSKRDMYFLKLKRRGFQEISLRIVEYLSDSGLSHLIPIIKTRQGKLSQPIGDFTLSVYPFIRGENGFRRKLNKDQWYSLGRALRQIHTIRLPDHFLQHLQQESHTPRWRQAVRALLYTVLETEPEGDAVALEFWKFIQKQKAVIQRLLNEAEALALEAQRQDVSRVLCHGDIHAGNILIDEKNVLYIVDWDAPIFAPKERDLMFIGGGVGGVWNQPQEDAWFYQGYGTVDINPILLAYYRYERILEDIAVYGQSLLLSTEGGEQRLQWYRDCCAQFEPKGVVDIAFKSYASLI